MSKIVFGIFAPILYLAALISMGLMFSDVGAIIYLYATLLFVVVLAPFFVLMIRAKNEKTKRKYRWVIILGLMLPCVLAFLRVILVIVLLFMTYN